MAKVTAVHRRRGEAKEKMTVTELMMKGTAKKPRVNEKVETKDRGMRDCNGDEDKEQEVGA